MDDWGTALDGLAAELRAAGHAEGTVRLRQAHLRQFAGVRDARGRLVHPEPLLVTGCRGRAGGILRPAGHRTRRRVQQPYTSPGRWITLPGTGAALVLLA